MVELVQAQHNVKMLKKASEIKQAQQHSAAKANRKASDCLLQGNIGHDFLVRQSAISDR